MSNIGPEIGLVRDATVKSIDLQRGVMNVVINLAKGDVFSRNISIPISASWAGPSGEFAGGCPIPGSTLNVALGQGGNWAALSYISNDNIFGSRNASSFIGIKRNIMSALRPGRHLIQVRKNINHIVDPDIGVRFGTANQFVHADPNRSIQSTVINSNMIFTEANRIITGPIFRDLQSNAVRNVSGSALTSHSYQESLIGIGLDPRTRPGNSFIRNPWFTESREITYEFSNSFNFTDDNTEASIYDGDEIPSVEPFFPRRESRADALSLSLISPNQIIETIKGTVVDIYGNLIDLNRNILPSGLIDNLSFRDNEESSVNTFRNLREQTRKSIAYHFELNARKDNIPDLSDIGSFVNNTLDFSRHRSKLFIDIDKEGQFKINIPASSNVGNIGLLVRHENYSTIQAADDGTDPREFVRNVNNQDIFLDSFGKGAIKLSGSEALDGYSSPTDRISDEPIKLGTAFHDISKTLEFFAFPEPIPQYSDSTLNTVDPIESVVSDNIIVSGSEANAGGRSGTIALDGHLSLNIGANTIDRQSLWIDCAGGVVSNYGRDINDISYAGRFDGDVFVQIGGSTPSDDSRFSNLNNAAKDGVFDLRIFANNQMHIVRFDNGGIRIFTPGSMDFVADGQIRFKSRRNNIVLDGEGIYMYGNERNTARWVARKPGKTID